MSDTDDASDFLADPEITPAPAEHQDGPPWRLLIVDDDESVHSISRVVLSEMHFRGRPVEILSAFSGREAAALLRARDDVAVVLLDVVMEEDDAGLKLVREIREDIGNRSLRIILRTGQPGQAPERQVILDYDINDYKSKAELTAQKLFTSTIAALRGYADIVALEQSRRGLERIIDAAPKLFSRLDLDGFAAGLLSQIGEIVGPNDSVLIVPRPEADGSALARVVGAAGAFAGTIGQEIAAALPTDLAALLAQACADRRPVSGPGLIVRLLHMSEGQTGAVLIRPASMPDADRMVLLDILCASVGVGLDNVVLHTRLLAQQAVLEDTVIARTRQLMEANRDLQATQTQLQEELRVAGTLQQSILPHAFPSIPGCTGVATMRPARSIGGDFYDIVTLDANRIGLVVADVSGKGAPAALFMVLVHTILQQLAARGLSPAEALAETNRWLMERNPLWLFVTILYGILDTRTGSFVFCSGGHGMPHIRRVNGDVEHFHGKPSPLVGLLEMAPYSEYTVQLAPGDAVVLNTDGIEEAMNARGDMFGGARLRAALGQAAGPADMLLRVLAAVEGFVEDTPASDDLTCLIARWEGPSSPD